MKGKIQAVACTSPENVTLLECLRTHGFDVHTWSSAQRLLRSGLQKTDEPSCILLELPNRRSHRLDQLQQLAIQHAPVVALAQDADIELCVTAMKIGAVDFLAAPVKVSELASAIQEALTKSSMDNLVRDIDQRFATRMDRLTIREHEVLLHLISGRLNKVIAADLGISEKTVKVHRARVLEKMQLRSLAELVRACTINGLEPANWQQQPHSQRKRPSFDQA